MTKDKRTESRTKRPAGKAAATAALAVLCCFLAITARAATLANTQISHPKTRATSASFTGSVYSNQAATTTVAPVFGFAANPFTAPAAIPLQITQGVPGGEATYNFSITNNGNTTDQVLVVIGPFSNTTVYPGVTWSVEVDDANPFVSGLTWQNSGTTLAKATGDRATSGVSLAPGGTAQFTLKVNGSGAAYGATMSFSVTLQTIGDKITPQYPAGAYAGFNAQNYAGPGSVTTANPFVPTIPPILQVIAPANGLETPDTTISVTGTSEAGASCTVTVTGPQGAMSQQYISTALIPDNGAISRQVNVFEGVNQVEVKVRDWNNNSTLLTHTVTRDATPPAISLSMQNEQVGTSIPIIGAVYDVQHHMESYAVYYGPGASPTTWKQIGTTSASEVGSSGTTGTLALWSTSGLSGQYTIKVVAADRAPFSKTSELYQTINLVNTTQFAGTLPVGKWTMVALPGKPLEADPRAFLGSGRYEVQYWDPTATADNDLLQYKTTNIVLNSPGQGFWVKPYTANISYSVPGYVTDTAASVTLHMYSGWNQIGSPYLTRGAFNANFTWGQVKVRINPGAAGEQTKFMADAITSGWVNSQFYGYNNTTNSYNSFGVADGLVPYTGYFIKTNQNCDLVFEPGAEIPGGMARIIRPQYEWKMQLSADAGDVRDDENFAAALTGSQEILDSADSSEPPPVKPYVSLYFENQDAGRNSARLASDARPPDAVRQTKTWNFIVEVSDPGKSVTLSTPDADKLPANYQYRIRDEATGAEYDPKQRQQYAFNETGTSRRFTLSALKLSEAPAATLTKLLPRGWSLFSAPLEPEPTDVRAQLAGKLSKIQVFQYFDRNMYDPESAERVDLQAGLGYWIYLDSATELDFKGMRTNPAANVDIPLSVGWNLIGNPFESVTIDAANIRVRDGAETLTLSEAVARGLMAPDIYEFDNSSGGYVQHPIGTPMSPWKGYAIKTLKQCALQIGPAQP
ncbi:MAG: hypothetical protein WCX65_04640 [bacterium]